MNRMDAFSATEFIGYAAGTIICLSAAPHILALIRRPEYGRYEPVTRTGLIVAGNLLWFVYGVLTASASMTVMSAIGCALNLVVLYFALISRYPLRIKISNLSRIYRRYSARRPGTRFQTD
jgi:uncharacterized protein with PQ loop repeat